MGAHLGLFAAMIILWQSPHAEGRITGRVVNSTRGNLPVDSAEVLLRVKIDGDFQVVAKTMADQDGRFVFEGLPLDQDLVYLPGANQDNIHYPGPRVRLNSDRSSAQVLLKVQDALTESNPLSIGDYAILVEAQPGSLRVTETMWIENPGTTTYVGRKPHASAEPVTLRLSIPPDFERVTFHEEFYGRQFSVINDKLVTGVPWTPGRRRLEFSYVLRNDAAHRSFVRPLDLPCRHVRVTVCTENPDGVSCNVGAPLRGADGSVSFASDQEELPAGYVVHLELSRLPVPVMAYARWAILAILVLVITASCVLMKRRRILEQDAQRTPIRQSRTGKRRVASGSGRVAR